LKYPAFKISTLIGREVILPFEIINQRKGITGGEETEKEAAHAQKIRERMQRAHVVARKNLQVNAKHLGFLGLVLVFLISKILHNS
jgi:polyferredoxin